MATTVAEPTTVDAIAAAVGTSIDLGTVELVLLIALLPLLVVSAFFSGAETLLFGFSENERIELRRRGGVAARCVEALLVEPRMLLVTVLLGNMTANTLYFVVCSVLILSLSLGVTLEVFFGIATLVTIVLLGEVFPKMTATTARVRLAPLIVPPLFAFHRAIAPLRIFVERLIVAPLGRLTAPRAAPPELDADELAALLTLSSEQGVIEADEQRLLEQVIRMRRMRVRDVMTPRVQMETVTEDATPAAVRNLAREKRLTRLPVHRGSVDQIVGILPVKAFLLDRRGETTRVRDHLRPIRFVPDVATLEKLLDHFRTTDSDLAVVVDEYGGTAGIVAMEDVVEELVGDIVSPEERAIPAPRRIRPERWLVSGDMSVHDWADAFGQSMERAHASTVGGLVLERLGRAPEVGDSVLLGNVQLQVTAMRDHRVTEVMMGLVTEDASGTGESESGTAKSTDDRGVDRAGDVARKDGEG